VDGTAVLATVAVEGCVLRALRSPLRVANQLELAMTMLFCCRFCRVEMARIGLADGTVALVCSDCEVVGLAHEFARGGRPWDARPEERRPQGARARRAE